MLRSLRTFLWICCRPVVDYRGLVHNMSKLTPLLRSVVSLLYGPQQIHILTRRDVVDLLLSFRFVVDC